MLEVELHIQQELADIAVVGSLVLEEEILDSPVALELDLVDRTRQEGGRRKFLGLAEVEEVGHYSPAGCFLGSSY
jgi:hypothetical protein